MLKPEFITHLESHPVLAPLAQDLLTSPEVSVRYNLAKTDIPADLIDVVPWCPEGRYLSERPAFTQDPALHQGLYYVQDASSMAITAAVREILPNLADNPRVLDACAAPGGKTTAALSVLPTDSLMVANEFDFRRAEILSENVAKWGSPNTLISRGDTVRLRQLPEFFDLIITDAPCSGEGMMRKDPQARQQWSLALVDQCARLQREILDNVWSALKPGGFLIYSTCTFNKDEDEHNVQWLVNQFGAETVSIPLLEAQSNVAKALDSDLHCYRFFPGRVRGEGLFLSVIRKPAAKEKSSRTSALEIKKSKGRNTAWVELSQKDALSLSKFVNGDNRFFVIGEDVFALPKDMTNDMLLAASKLDVISMGIWVATIKGKDLVPAHTLALSTSLNQKAFPQVEVDYPTAIAYLQRQAITVDAPRGFVLLMYKRHPLGFVKNLGNRSNNLYPKNWRIRNQS